MSRANKQSEIMIGAVAGCFEQIRVHNHYSRIDIKQEIEWGYRKTIEVLFLWPRDKPNKNDMNFFRETLSLWATEMGARQEKLTGATLTYIATRILTDLEAKINNKVKLDLLAGIWPHLKAISNFSDPEGLNFIAFEEGDKMLDLLYKIIEWEY